MMARFAKLVLVLVSGVGFAIGSPVESQAGVIPWVYDAIFGPVGSMYGGGGGGYPMSVGYAPAYSAGYAPYSVGYAPYNVSYAPVSMAQYSSSGSGCNSCSQAAYYGPVMGNEGYASAACSTCGSGNCSTGANCSNCNVNSGSTTSGYGPAGISGPVPDSNHNARGETSRIRDLERKIEELDHREKQTERFLKRQNADYIPEPFRPSTYLEEEVPARRKQMSIESDSANPNNFQTPINRGRTAPSNLPTEEENRKPVLSIPGQGEGGTSIQNHDANGSFKETEPQALQIERRLTSRAIVPRERMQIVTKQSKLSSVAKTPQHPATTVESTRPAELARN